MENITYFELTKKERISLQESIKTIQKIQGHLNDTHMKRIEEETLNKEDSIYYLEEIKTLLNYMKRESTRLNDYIDKSLTTIDQIKTNQK